MSSLFPLLFFEVSTPQQKKECISSVSHHHFIKGSKLLFIVEDERSGKFLDQLLWSFPPESFLPHTLAKIPKLERLMIAVKGETLWKEADVIFNLQNEILQCEESPKLVIEFFDKSDPERADRAKKRLEEYSSKGHPVKCVGWSSTLGFFD